MNNEIETLVTDAQRGCRDALQNIFRLYKRKLYHLAYGMTGNKEDAEDLLQEIFTKIFSSIDSFGLRDNGGFTTWILRIGTNHSINFVKKRSRRPVSCDDIDKSMESSEKGPETILEMMETGKLLGRYLTRLSPKQRVVLVQRYYNGMKIREIAEVMKCHEGSVKRHMYRGLDKLRNIVDKDIKV